jgi:outer membrane receptor protein involved in Fe transport
MGRDSRTRAARLTRPTRTSVGTAVLLALYGSPDVGFAQQAPDASAAALQEVVVTANRRNQTLEEVPYSLTVVSADQLAIGGVTDIASLASQVPGLSLFDFGARLSAATTPIIRGLNGTGESADRPFRSFEQSPVGVYIGNSPIDGYFQLDDVSHIEVLRGPQGTLYGAGALGGALRIIPNDPELGVTSARVDASLGSLAHSSGTAYTAAGVVNVPLGDTLAFRAAGKFAYEPGFIDVFGIVKRTGSALYGAPVLADPSDPVNSPAIYSGKNDWNDQNTFTGRASLLWKPVSNFSAELAFLYSNLNGDGGPQTNTSFKGGPYYIDPRIIFPAGGDYRDLVSFNQPYWRRTNLTSLDLSYDAGFATISSTSSYFTTTGLTQDEGTYSVGGIAGFNAYYSGSPLNPRFVYGQEFTDQTHTFTQEVRIVSTAGPDKPLDYVFGLFYEQQGTTGTWLTSTPGSPERAIAEGCTGPVYFGSTFPNCLLTVGPNDTPFTQSDNQQFTDKSVFGEATWHFLPHGQVTFGGRHFEQSFTDAQSYFDYPFQTFIPATPHNAPASKNTWKINPSYEYAPRQFLYATWSQGFRRGGANSVPLTGFFKESPLLASYTPDSVNNYEIGLKGRLDNGTTYTLAVFDMRWDKPQISASLPSGNLAVYNANTAESKGVELELHGPLLIEGLSYTIGGAYVNAQLTSDFALPANCGCGTGQIVPGLLSGTSGEQMPGTPKTSAAGTVTYEHLLAPGYQWSFSVNQTYRSSVPLFLSYINQSGSAFQSPAFGILNLSTSVTHKSWRFGAYVKNTLDKRVALIPSVPAPILSDPTLATTELINTPREAGLRIGYTF